MLAGREAVFFDEMGQLGLPPGSEWTRCATEGQTCTFPGQRWLAYSDRAFTAAWLEPFPADGRRYQLKSGGAGEAHWLSASELLVWYLDSTGFIADRVRFVSSPATGVSRTPWIRLPRFLDPPGLSAAVTPDGGLLYVQGAPATPVSHFRVVPNWVAAMKRAVDESAR